LYQPPSDTVKKTKGTPIVKTQKARKRLMILQNMRQMKIDTPNNTAIIELNTFSKGKLRGFFRRSFKKIRQNKIKNIVLDLRSNGGGKIASSTLLTKYLTRKPFKIADSSFAVAKSLGPYTKYIKGKGLNNLGLFFLTKKRADGNYHFGMWERKYFQPKTKNHFGGDLYVLTNGPTFSAAALVCNDLKGQPGITLLGEETGGGWYGNSGIMIPDITLPNTKMRVRLPLFRLVQSNHMIKNGRGIQPDIYVGTSYEALLNNYDKKMRVVMEIIKQKAVSGGQ
jgi:C-terminal processing protease CtpA/Prc